MKKIILLFTTFFFVSFFTNAQKVDKRSERSAKIKALKIAFITEQLNLTSTEAQQFWPIYNKFDDKLHQLERVEKHKLLVKIKDAGSVENISEDEAKSIMQNITVLNKQIHNTKVAQDNELTKVLSYKKTLKLKTVEIDFVRNLMKKYRRKRNKDKK